MRDGGATADENRSRPQREPNPAAAFREWTHRIQVIETRLGPFPECSIGRTVSCICVHLSVSVAIFRATTKRWHVNGTFSGRFPQDPKLPF